MVKQYTKYNEMRSLISQTKTEIEMYNVNKYSTAVLVFKDMLFYLQIWRQVKGYSKNSQRTHSNNKTNKKRKIINSFRLQQFYRLFGRKRRDIFPTLSIAEYTKRLWYLVWYEQWVFAWVFICNLAVKNKGIVKFDPQLVSKNAVTGVPSVKKKKKHNTAKKKIIAVATIGLPILFSLYLYNYKGTYKFPFKLVIGDDTRKKMGKKQKKNKKK
jgi:hypothetical protein